jgi:hypothetical protein
VSPDGAGPGVERRSGPVAPARRAGRRLSPQGRLRLGSLALVLVAVLALIAAFSPWWYTTTSSGATSSTAEFYPGTTFYAGGGGGGGVTSYASYGLGSVGGLYVGILVTSILLALLAGAVGLYGLGRASGRFGGSGGPRLARIALLAALGAAVVLAVVVPVAQPALYQAANPAGTCSPAPPASPCTSFWGTSHAGGSTTVWGAGAGWWLDILAALFVVVGLYLGTSAVLSERDAERRREEAASTELARRSAPPLQLEDLVGLAELKRRSDAGELPEAAFLEAKAHLLGPVPATDLLGPGARTPLPSRELDVLQELRDDGALTDEEYDLLRRRLLLWI